MTRAVWTMHSGTVYSNFLCFLSVSLWFSPPCEADTVPHNFKDVIPLLPLGGAMTVTEYWRVRVSVKRLFFLWLWVCSIWSQRFKQVRFNELGWLT